MDTGKSALGLDGNLAAALGYPIGIIAIICVIMEKENRFVKFHALQSILYHVAAIVVFIVVIIVLVILSILLALARVGELSALLWLLYMVVFLWLFRRTNFRGSQSLWRQLLQTSRYRKHRREVR